MRRRKTVEGDIPIADFERRREPVSEQHLTDIFSDVGRRHGCYDVVARFDDRPKVTWKRSCRWTRVTVSDNLADAPDSILRELAEDMYDRMDDKPYDEYTLLMFTSCDPVAI